MGSKLVLKRRLRPRFSIQCEHTHVPQSCPGANILRQHLEDECAHLLTLCSLLSEGFPACPSPRHAGVCDSRLWLLHTGRAFQGRRVFQPFPVPVLPPPGDERNEGLPAISLPSALCLFHRHPPLLQLEGGLAASQLLWLRCPMCAACCEPRSEEDGTLTLLVKTQLLGTKAGFGKSKRPPRSLFSMLHLLGGGNSP